MFRRHPPTRGTPYSAVPAQSGAAQPVQAQRASSPARERVIPTTDSWQSEAWSFYDGLGEFRYAVSWKAEMVSRIRLRAGKLEPDQDEPEIVDAGPAAELVDTLLQGSVGGRGNLMRSFTLQLSVPGECWLVGEVLDGQEQWRVRSTEEIREAHGGGVWEVIDDRRTRTGTGDRWRPLSPDSLVTRVWEPHPVKYARADSPARAARATMRELEFVNRHIVAQLQSRLAMAGMVYIPNEVTFPVRPEFQDAADPVVLEWIEAAREAIQNQGSASAVIPMVFRGPAEFADAFKFIDPTVTLDEQILAKRESAIRRLATQLDLPAEILLGMGDINHWSAWQLEESGIKAHILPLVERIVDALTVGYLRPRLLAAGEDPEGQVVWYDASEITIRPDRSAQATEAYDRLEINGEAYRREVGFDEADVPSDEELAEQILKALSKDPTNALTALHELTGVTAEAIATSPAVTGAPEEPGTQGEQQGPPGTQGEAPPPPEEAPPAQAASGDLADRLRPLVAAAQAVQGDTRHWLVRDLHGHRVTHPDACAGLPIRCPYAALTPRSVPGRTGTYLLTLQRHNGGAQLVVGPLRQDLTDAHRGA